MPDNWPDPGNLSRESEKDAREEALLERWARRFAPGYATPVLVAYFKEELRLFLADTGVRQYVLDAVAAGIEGQLARHIKHREKLFQDIADGLKALDQPLNVKFRRCDEVLKTLSVAEALDSIVNDLFWDVDANWSEADNAIVEVL